jgi:hypothetical protein
LFLSNIESSQPANDWQRPYPAHHRPFFLADALQAFHAHEAAFRRAIVDDLISSMFLVAPNLPFAATTARG